MNFNDLLALKGYDPRDVALCLHKPGNPEQRRALCVMAAEDPAAFDAYQSTHSVIPEATLRKRAILASFVPHEEGTFNFVGLFAREVGPLCVLNTVLKDEAFRRMLARMDGTKSPLEIEATFKGRVKFELTQVAALSELRGRLLLKDPQGRNYMRLADTTALEVDSILSGENITPPMPAWDNLALTASELRNLPRDWAATLAAWRGIYLIVDEKDGQRYVGAAYGDQNLFGRWRAHVAGDIGVSKELSKRQTDGFRFSILELMSPAAAIGEVTRKERTWMDRLHTIRYGLNT